MPGSEVLCVGEVLWDSLPAGLFLGGAPFNVACHLRAAGVPAALVSRVGRDGLGDSVVLRAGPATSAPGVLVLSHLDTVHPVGTIDADLPLRIEDDRLYGPGAYDMKGGAWLALQAFKEAAHGTAARRPPGERSGGGR